jgi:hypothetical protein
VAGFAAEGNRDFATARGRFVGLDMISVRDSLKAGEGY